MLFVIEQQYKFRRIMDLKSHFVNCGYQQDELAMIYYSS